MTHQDPIKKAEINQLPLRNIAQRLLAHPKSKTERHQLQGRFDNTPLDRDTVYSWLLACQATSKGSEHEHLNYHRQAFVKRVKKLNPASIEDQVVVKYIRQSDVYNNDPIFYAAIHPYLVKFKS